MPKVPLYNTFNFLKCARMRHVKCLFTNIQKQYNMLKIRLFFKKFTKFMRKHSKILRTIVALKFALNLHYPFDETTILKEYY